MRFDTYEIAPDERVVLECRFDYSHFLWKLFLFATLIIRPFMKPFGEGATLTDKRVIKRFKKGRCLSLPLDRVERVYWNTTGSSFAVVASPDRSVFLWWLFGRGRRGSLGLPLVVEPESLARAFESVGLSVEKERLSPKRSFLS